METTSCLICDVNRTCLFSCLTGESLRQLQRERVFRHFRRRQIVFYQGDELPFVSCIQSGAVKLFKTNRYNKEVVIRLLGPGDILGHRPILAEELTAATAEAIAPTTLCMIPKAAFLHVAKSSDELRTALLRQLARDLRESEEQWFISKNDSVEMRVKAVLLRLAEQAGHLPRAQSEVQITIPRVEIAQAVGITPSTLSRVLKKLAARGMLKLEPRAIKIITTSGTKLLE